MPATSNRITFSERAVSALVAFLGAAITAGIVLAGGMLLGFSVWVPIPWLGLFAAFMALLGFLVGPVQIVEIFGFLWGTETTLSRKAQLIIVTVIVGAIWAILFLNYFQQ
jgi:hypothetical protein